MMKIAKFGIACILLLVTYSCGAHAQRRIKTFARQTVAGGYPPAGITPETPFELPTTPKPDVSYLPPENTYGPPVNETPDENPNEDPELPTPPAEQTVPNEEDVIVAVAKDGTVIAVSTSYDQNGRYQVYQRFPQGRRQTPVPAPEAIPARFLQAQDAAALRPQRSYFFAAQQLQQW